MKHLFHLILLFSVTTLIAQTSPQPVFDFAHGIGTFHDDSGYYAASDSDGNILITGTYGGYSDFDPGPGESDGMDLSSGYRNSFVVKLNADQEYLWGHQVGHYTGHEGGTAITADMDNNVISVGYYESNIVFDGQAYANQGEEDIYIEKKDAQGNHLWGRGFGGWDFDVPTALSTDQNGNIITTGTFIDAIDIDPSSGNTEYLYSTGSGFDNQDIFIQKLDPDGNLLWGKHIGGPYEDGTYQTSTDLEGNVYTIGYFEGTVDFDPGPNTVNLIAGGNLTKIFILKLDSDGNFVWVKEIASSIYSNYELTATSTRKHDIQFDEGGFLYISGHYGWNNNITLWDGTTFPSGDNTNLYFLKIDLDANVIWSKTITEGNAIVRDSRLDKDGNLYVMGRFYETMDLDPGIDSLIVTSPEYTYSPANVYVMKMDAEGNVLWANRIVDGPLGSGEFKPHSLCLDGGGKIFITGEYSGSTSGFDFNYGSDEFIIEGDDDMFYLWLKQKGIYGNVFLDYESDCVDNEYDNNIDNRNILIEPGGYIAETVASGNWYIDSIPPGTYTATVDTSGYWQSTCPPSQTFTITSGNDIVSIPDFGLITELDCPDPDVTIMAPFLRRCFDDQRVYVSVCNLDLATDILPDATVRVILDEFLTVNSASLPYVDLGSNNYEFSIGDLYPGNCIEFYISTTVSCETELGDVLCMDASLFPVEDCMLDDTPNPYPGDGVTPCTSVWDNSSLEVDGYCENGDIFFTVTNIGTGDMTCFAPVRVYINGNLIVLDSVQLTAGAIANFDFDGDGQTWLLEANQHPLHPGDSYPNLVIEGCGGVIAYPRVNEHHLDDEDSVVDRYCGEVTGSYDPNDKAGYPYGVGEENNIYPNRDIEYLIRFQNTGTDTAFTVVIRDTLDYDLEILSVHSGLASHGYTFRKYGPRVLEWTFENILLPDSTTNEQLSHGFVTFKVDQLLDLPSGTQINNRVGIYFDFNDPIITNTTLHTINRDMQDISYTTTNTITESVCESFEYNDITYDNSGTYYQLSEDNTELIILELDIIPEMNIQLEDGVLTSSNTEGTYQWLDCDNDLQAIEGKVSSSFSPSQNGNYALQITEGTCSEISECFNVTFTHNSNIEFLQKTSIIPNPNNGNFILDFGNNYNDLVIQITDIRGRIIQENIHSSGNIFSCSTNVSSGLYFLHISDKEGNRRVLKWVKK